MNRIVGLETEYGCLSSELAGTPGAVTRTRDYIFQNDRFGLIDVHQRDWDEPAGNGGFLYNGGRAYVDMGHLEYCTPECVDLLDVLKYDRAGDLILCQAVRDMHLSKNVNFIRNNIDHHSGATFGCHENYLLRRYAPLTEDNIHSLLAFLTVRILMTSSGRVGAALAPESRRNHGKNSEDNIFQISQRADYINNDLFEWVQFNRAIINTRDEPLGDARKFRRLHLLHGDSNVLPTTLLLKVGTTSLVLDLLEANAMPDIRLADAVLSYRQFSHNPDGPWTAPLANGKSMDAIELLGLYRSKASETFAGRDKETDILLDEWKLTLENLQNDRQALVGKIDWITKQFILQAFKDEEKLEWNSEWMKSQDLEYHHIDKDRNLGLALENTREEWNLAKPLLTGAMTHPPENSRAFARSRLMEEMRSKGLSSYYLDWEVVGLEGKHSLSLLDPFDPDPRAAMAWLEKTLAEDSPPAKARGKD